MRRSQDMIDRWFLNRRFESLVLHTPGTRVLPAPAVSSEQASHADYYRPALVIAVLGIDVGHRYLRVFVDGLACPNNQVLKRSLGSGRS